MVDTPPRYVQDDKVQDLCRRVEKRFSETVKRIKFCRDIQRGTIGVSLPKTYVGQDKELSQVLIPSMPIKQTLPIQMTAKMSKKFEKCTLKRFPLAPNDGARKAATDFETWINFVVDAILNSRGVIGRDVQQGAHGIFVMPSTVDWAKSPDYIDSVTEGEKRTPNKKYDRDAKGKEPDESGYGGRDEEFSAKAHKGDLDAYLARRIPFVARVESPLNCFPILARGRGKEPWDTIGIVVKTLYEREELIRRKYRWPSQENAALIPVDPSDSTYGSCGQIWLYEAWMLDENGDPYIAYSAGGEQTTMEDGGGAVINLREEYGMTRLPCRYFWGNHLEDDNPDERAIPLLHPIATSILNVEAHWAHELVYGRKTAFPGFGVDVNPDLPPAAFLDDKGNLKEIKMPADGAVILLPGRMAPLQAPRTGDSLRYLTGALLGQLSESTPSPSVVGGGGGASGHQDVIQNEYFEASQEMILEAARQTKEFIGEIIAEYACAAAQGKWRVLDGKGVEIPCYVNAEVTPGNDSQGTSPLRTISTFKERWIGPGIYDLTAVYPNEGNLAEIQQVAELKKEGLATFDDVMEARGKTAPEVERAKIDADKWLDSDAGQQYLAQRFLAYRGQIDDAEKTKEQLAGRLSGNEQTMNPLPNVALAQPGQGQGAPMTGTSVPNLAASALGGAVAGQIGGAAQMNDALATSQITPGGAG